MSDVVENRLDFMDKMSEDDSVVFRNFLKKYSINKGKIFFFLEGVDDIKFYFKKFEDYFGSYDEKWCYLVCDNRSNVIQLIEDLSTHSHDDYKFCPYLGFIDKDYNDIEDNKFSDKIYVTPSYSIENFYSTNCFFKKMLKLEFNLSENHPNNDDYNNVYQNFISRRRDFLQQILDLECLLRLHNIKYENGDTALKLNLRDFKISKYSYIGFDRFELYLDKIKVALSLDSNLCDQDDLDNIKESYLNKCDEELNLLVRGKFIFEFFYNYLHLLVEDNHHNDPKVFKYSYINSKRARNDPLKEKLIKTKLKFCKKDHDLLSTLSKYLTYPQCLDDFLEKNLTLLRAV